MAEEKVTKPVDPAKAKKAEVRKKKTVAAKTQGPGPLKRESVVSGPAVRLPGPTKGEDCQLFNRLSQPITISYGGDSLILAPREKSKPLKRSHLGAIPKGVVALDLKKK